jgi:hypothetical protein
MFVVSILSNDRVTQATSSGLIHRFPHKVFHRLIHGGTANVQPRDALRLVANRDLLEFAGLCVMQSPALAAA